MILKHPQKVCKNLIDSVAPTKKLLEQNKNINVSIEFVSCILVDEGSIISDYQLVLEVNGLDCKSDTYEIIKTSNFNLGIVNKVDGIRHFEERFNGRASKTHFLAIRNCQ